MKKLLALLLSLLLCLSFVASCNREEEISSSSSGEPTSEASSSGEPTSEEPSSSEESTIPGYYDRTATVEISNDITIYSISEPYTAYTDKIYHRISNFSADGLGACATVITNYYQFLESPVYDAALSLISPKLFEDNFIILTEMAWEADIKTHSYTDFQKDLLYYTITANSLVVGKVLEKPAFGIARDICVIPRELCEEDPSQIEVRIIQKEYEFKGTAFESECKVTTIFPE